MGKLKLIHSECWSYSLYEDEDENLILSVLCGTVGLYETNIILNEEEIKNYESKKNDFLKSISDVIRRKPSAYRDRHIRIDHKVMTEAHKKQGG